MWRDASRADQDTQGPGHLGVRWLIPLVCVLVLGLFLGLRSNLEMAVPLGSDAAMQGLLAMGLLRGEPPQVASISPPWWSWLPCSGACRSGSLAARSPSCLWRRCPWWSMGPPDTRVRGAGRLCLRLSGPGPVRPCADWAHPTSAPFSELGRRHRVLRCRYRLAGVDKQPPRIPAKAGLRGPPRPR